MVALLRVGQHGEHVEPREEHECLARATGADLGRRRMLVNMVDSGSVPVRVVQPLFGVLPVPNEIPVALRILSS